MALISCSVYAHRLRSSSQPRDWLWCFSSWREHMRSGDSQLHSQVVVHCAEEKASSDGTADAGITSMSKTILNMIGYWCYFFYVHHECLIAKTWFVLHIPSTSTVSTHLKNISSLHSSVLSALYWFISLWVMVVWQIGGLLAGSPVAVFAVGAEGSFEVTSKDYLHIFPNAAKFIDMQTKNSTDSDWGRPGMPQPKPLLDVVVPIPSSFSIIWYRC